MNHRTIQAKALFFAQYQGQRNYQKPLHKNGHLSEYFCPVSAAHKNGYLILRSVSQLTDEECIEIGKFYGWKIGNTPYVTKQNYIDSVRKKLTAYSDGLINIIAPVAQYCLRLGILLKFVYINEENKPVTLQPDEILKLGWAKINEV